jgi:transcription-repair coupling factor (superfamily II helicase)
MSFFNFPKQSQTLSQYWGGLYGCSQSLALIEFTKKYDDVILVIADDIKHSEVIKKEILFFDNQQTVLTFPDWEVLPYDSFSPHQAIISQRLKTLQQLQHLKKAIVIITLEALIQRLCPQKFLNKYSFIMDVGSTLNIESFSYQLLSLGYNRVQKVITHGEFSIKGSIIDVFAMGSKEPFRLDLFDDEIETIRFFDVDTQRSIREVKNIELLPAKEFSTDEQSITTFSKNYQKHFSSDTGVVIDAIKQKHLIGGIEFYLPLFFEKTADFFDYLPKNLVIWTQNNLNDKVIALSEQIAKRYEEIKIDRQILQPDVIFLRTEELFSKLKQHPKIVIQEIKVEEKNNYCNFSSQLLNPITIQNEAKKPLRRILEFIDKFEGKILFVVESLGRQNFLTELFKTQTLPLQILNTWQDFTTSKEKLNITVGDINRNLILDNIVLISEDALFGQTLVQQKRRRRAKHKDFGERVKNLIELSEGDAVVHEQYGVGRYLGLISIEYDEQPQDFIRILYADNAKLMVPISALSLISRYSAASVDNAPLHRLGSGQWAKIKKKAAESLHDVATELLDIYAKRAQSKGFVMEEPSDAYNTFVSEFPFEETPDQQKAIDEVLLDMHKPQPMDRLVCGDVGFGKTEIAMRAAFIAVESGKQVSILVPTTLLANQHLESFVNRFAKHPINISVVSRFQTAKQQKITLESLTRGKVDILIGTHRLLNKGIKYHNLGLMIVDEEHRFGVKQKEKLKGLKSEIDILTMTATPIPRTLNMALGSLKDLSVIATPPNKRVAIKTFVSEFNKGTIKEACLREVHRGGQIFFLHNEIDSIDLMAEKLEKLMPNISLRIAHGQMPERELEAVMQDFYHQKFQLLLCTTIIETGIDMPTANTIVINNAQKFGLAQLHQLRGRVGRSHHQAYAYLMIKSKLSLTDNAKKRLDAIASLEDLGVGFMLANHDLEIRGAGELLGEGQSGKIHEIGFALYHDLLQRTITAMRENKKVDLTTPQEIEIDLDFAAILPKDYIFDTADRLVFYKRIASSEDKQTLDDIKMELIDRFGLLPNSAHNLFAVTTLKQAAKLMGIEQIIVNDIRMKIVFNQEPNIDTDKFIMQLQQNPQSYKFDGKKVLTVIQKTTIEDRLESIDKVLSSFKKQL